MGKVSKHPAASGQAVLRAPAPLSAAHDFREFDSRKPILDSWLRDRANRNESQRATRTFVVCAGNQVVGFYSLAAGAVMRETLPTARLRKNMPEEIPVVVVARLAVDLKFQGQRIGPGLLKDALQRAIGVSTSIGVRAILVHALDDDAVNFYRKFGFISCPVDHRTLLLPIETAVRACEG